MLSSSNLLASKMQLYNLDLSQRNITLNLGINTFCPGTQQDAQEFLTFLFQKLLNMMPPRYGIQVGLYIIMMIALTLVDSLMLSCVRLM